MVNVLEIIRKQVEEEYQEYKEAILERSSIDIYNHAKEISIHDEIYYFICIDDVLEELIKTEEDALDGYDTVSNILEDVYEQVCYNRYYGERSIYNILLERFDIN